jgi:spermidine synthase
MLFDYNQRLLEAALSLRPARVLVIGGGAFTLPRAILTYLPSAHVDVVEIDPLLPRLARKYFQLKHNRRLKVYVADGRDYINQCQRTYDLIIVDAFHEYDIPISLLTVEAVQDYARLLAPGGSLAMNIIARYRSSTPTLIHRVMASLRPGFTSLALFPADVHDSPRDEHNLILVASHQTVPNLDYLLSNEVYPQMFDEELLQLRDTNNS